MDWRDFFRTCGIPDAEAKQYAAIFRENRITKDILRDLNKELLRDMGIVVVGDIINILKQARTFHPKEKQQEQQQDEQKEVQQETRTVKVVLPKPIPMIRPSENSPVVKTPPVKENSVSTRLGPQEGIFGRLGSAEQEQRRVTIKPGAHVNRSAYSRLDSDVEKEESHWRSRNENTDDEISGASKTPIRLTRPSPANDIDKPIRSNVLDKPIRSEPSAKKKKYIMIRTLANGDKIKEMIEEGDPILQKFPVKKKQVPKALEEKLAAPSPKPSAMARLDDRRVTSNRFSAYDEDKAYSAYNNPDRRSSLENGRTSHDNGRFDAGNVRNRLDGPPTRINRLSDPIRSRLSPVKRNPSPVTSRLSPVKRRLSPPSSSIRTSGITRERVNPSIVRTSSAMRSAENNTFRSSDFSRPNGSPSDNRSAKAALYSSMRKPPSNDSYSSRRDVRSRLSEPTNVVRLTRPAQSLRSDSQFSPPREPRKRQRISPPPSDVKQRLALPPKAAVRHRISPPESDEIPRKALKYSGRIGDRKRISY